MTGWDRLQPYLLWTTLAVLSFCNCNTHKSPSEACKAKAFQPDFIWSYTETMRDLILSVFSSCDQTIRSNVWQLNDPQVWVLRATGTGSLEKCGFGGPHRSHVGWLCKQLVPASSLKAGDVGCLFWENLHSSFINIQSCTQNLALKSPFQILPLIKNDIGSVALLRLKYFFQTYNPLLYITIHLDIYFFRIKPFLFASI